MTRTSGERRSFNGPVVYLRARDLNGARALDESCLSREEPPRNPRCEVQFVHVAVPAPTQKQQKRNYL